MIPVSLGFDFKTENPKRLRPFALLATPRAAEHIAPRFLSTGKTTIAIALLPLRCTMPRGDTGQLLIQGRQRLLFLPLAQKAQFDMPFHQA